MANSQLFASRRNPINTPQADALNQAGVPADTFSPRQPLAQYAATGCLNTRFHASASDQLEQVLALCDQVAPPFIAQTAVHCRQRGYMKDMTMQINFVQILRSGVTGRKSLGSRPKKLVQAWLNSASSLSDLRSRSEKIAGRGQILEDFAVPIALYWPRKRQNMARSRYFCSRRARVRQAASEQQLLADVLKMVHPKPAAALVAAALLNRNPTTGVLPFDTTVVDWRLEPRGSVLENPARLAAIAGGGAFPTRCLPSSKPSQQAAWAPRAGPARSRRRIIRRVP